MRNKKKLIAEIMAVCCTLSTSTFFNMYGMAAAEKEQQVLEKVEKFIYKVEGADGEKIITTGENIEATLNCEVVPIIHNIGCIKYEIDFRDDYSPDRLNEVLTKLAIKKDSENGAFIAMSDLVQDGVAKAPVEIYNLKHFFDSESSSLIKFSISTKKNGDTNSYSLKFGASETTDQCSQTNYGETFSVCRIEGKTPTIKYDEKDHKMILKIYVDLPDIYYESFTVTATLDKDNSILSMISQN